MYTADRHSIFCTLLLIAAAMAVGVLIGTNELTSRKNLASSQYVGVCQEAKDETLRR